MTKASLQTCLVLLAVWVLIGLTGLLGRLPGGGAMGMGQNTLVARAHAGHCRRDE